MPDTIEILVPEITAAVITSNPATINASITVSVTVTEKTVVLVPEVIYSGEIYSGDDDWI